MSVFVMFVGVLSYISTQYLCNGGPNEAKNEAKTRPENSFGNPSALATVYHQPGSKCLAQAWQQLSSSLQAARFARCLW